MSEGTGVLDDLLAEAATSGPDAVVDKLGNDDVARLAQEISTPGELRRLVEFAGDDTGMIDRLVERILGKAGSEVLLDRVFDLMPGRFLGERLRTERGTIEWHVTTPDGPQVYHLKIADGVAESGRGAAGNPRVTLTLSAPDLLRLCAGTLNGLTAFMNGSIKLNGDMLFGAKLPAAFDTSAD